MAGKAGDGIGEDAGGADEGEEEDGVEDEGGKVRNGHGIVGVSLGGPEADETEGDIEACNDWLIGC